MQQQASNLILFNPILYKQSRKKGKNQKMNRQKRRTLMAASPLLTYLAPVPNLHITLNETAFGLLRVQFRKHLIIQTRSQVREGVLPPSLEAYQSFPPNIQYSTNKKRVPVNSFFRLINFPVPIQYSLWIGTLGIHLSSQFLNQSMYHNPPGSPILKLKHHSRYFLSFSPTSTFTLTPSIANLAF